MDSIAAGIGYLLKQVQGRLHTALATALKEHDLTVAQYATLVAVSDEPGLSNADLARRTFVTPQSSHRLLAELEDAGLVARTPHPAHRRILQSQLTAAGTRRLRAANAAAEAVEGAMLRGLPAKDRTALKAALQSCDAQLADLVGQGDAGHAAAAAPRTTRARRPAGQPLAGDLAASDLAAHT